MKEINLEEILWDSFRNNGIPKPTHTLADVTKKVVKEAMKEAVKQVLELAAENALINFLIDNENDIVEEASIDKQSIINTINQVK